MMTIFDVIADPTRRHIMHLLSQRPHMVGELVEALQISQPGVSKQLRVLREADLVTVHREAQKRWYVLTPEPLQEISDWLSEFHQTWSTRHDNLESYLEQLQYQERDNDNEQ